MNDSNRGTGRTTDAMKSAPIRAVYVWGNAALDYPRALARTLGRTDLEIVSPSWLTDDRWRGRELSGIILDHHALDVLNKEQWKHLRYARSCVRVSP